MTDDPLNEALDALEVMVAQYTPDCVDGFYDHEFMAAGEQAVEALDRYRPTRCGWRRGTSSGVHNCRSVTTRHEPRQDVCGAGASGPHGIGSAARMTAVRRYEATVYDSNRWDGFEFRRGDIIISTPPRCGTTWTQMICVLLILHDRSSRSRWTRSRRGSTC